jgi:undecaprenyl-diphosphatase
MAMILLTGLARIYLQVHFPSDVAAGWSAGAVILAGAVLFLEAWEQRVRGW